TEYNGHMFPTKRYDDEAKRLNHAIRHLNVLNAALDEHNDISGAIGWCMSDYNTHREFGSGDRVCYHGITDMFRIPKLASVVYKAEFNLNPMMVVSSEMNIGDYPAAHIERIFIFTNVEYVRLYKNDKYINTFYPSNKAYPNLKHPPVVIDDFIGGLLKREEKMSQKDAETTKDILKAVTQYGANLPLRYKVKTLFILKKYKMTYDEGVKMFYKYMSGWGKGKTSYRFDGYKNRQLAVSVIKEHNEKFIYELTSSRKVLFIEDTYDATRYVIRKVNQHGETINYSFDPIEINVYGSIELIGPRKVSLQGGALAFWVKSNNQRGIGKIEVRTPTVMIKDEVMVK
ncbi:MAG: glycoside hydrolase family 2 protein, partial [Acholeplasmataceae bacterium]|nr:glycoside hydrolase family 2 protein [Acholeplasmataceae bacterium]